MNKELYLLKSGDQFIKTGRPYTIRVYESIESAKRGIAQLNRSGIKILRISDLTEVK